MQSIRYWYPILVKLGILAGIIVNLSGVTFYEISSLVFSCYMRKTDRQTNVHDEVNMRISCKSTVSAPKVSACYLCYNSKLLDGIRLILALMAYPKI
jgi:hypothetical protein